MGVSSYFLTPVTLCAIIVQYMDNNMIVSCCNDQRSLK